MGSMTVAQRRGITAILVAVALLAIGAVIGIIEGRLVGESIEIAPDPIGPREAELAWVARALLVLGVGWLAIGMLAARTSLVGRPGAAAARASWLGATRPWRARESTLGMLALDRWLLVIVPAGLLVATRALQTAFLSWTQLAAVLGAWLLCAVIVRALVGRRSPWPIIAAVGGVIVLRCVVALFALSFSGPDGYWDEFWADPVRRSIYIAVAFALFLWVFVAGAWALSVQTGVPRAAGTILVGVGAALAVPAAAIGLAGQEGALALWNDRLGLFPWGLAHVLGTALAGVEPWIAVALGVLLAAVGAAVLVTARGDAAEAEASVVRE